ncbi:MAG: glycosyltransferase [Pseudomonadota bacterium]
MQVSLIIPTYNREELLVAILACALQQDCTAYEIILVDQTAQHTPETEEFLSDHAAQIKLIRQSPPSLTKARNEGIRQAKGDVIVFIDDDTSFSLVIMRGIVLKGAGLSILWTYVWPLRIFTPATVAAGVVEFTKNVA